MHSLSLPELIAIGGGAMLLAASLIGFAMRRAMTSVHTGPRIPK